MSEEYNFMVSVELWQDGAVCSDDAIDSETLTASVDYETAKKIFDEIVTKFQVET